MRENKRLMFIMCLCCIALALVAYFFINSEEKHTIKNNTKQTQNSVRGNLKKSINDIVKMQDRTKVQQQNSNQLSAFEKAVIALESKGKPQDNVESYKFLKNISEAVSVEPLYERKGLWQE